MNTVTLVSCQFFSSKKNEKKEEEDNHPSHKQLTTQRETQVDIKCWLYFFG